MDSRKQKIEHFSESIKVGEINYQYNQILDIDTLGNPILGVIIDNFNVKETHRKQGIGTILLNSVLKNISDYKGEIVAHCNSNSVGIFTKAGFVNNEEVINGFFVMVKRNVS